MTNRHAPELQSVRIEPNGLQGLLGVCDGPKGLIVIAHGGSGGRLNPRNNHVAARLRQGGCATLLLDLLRSNEEEKRANIFNIPLLASRLLSAAKWASHHEGISNFPIGYFGTGTGAAAALVAATNAEIEAAAIVSCSGRLDLAGPSLAEVYTPALLIAGDRDLQVLDLNRHAYDKIPGNKEMMIVPGAGNIFDEPDTLDRAIVMTLDWFISHFPLARKAERPDAGSA